MVSGSECDPPCVNYSLNYNDDNFQDIHDFIYTQIEDCKEKNNCSTAPLLDEKGQSFFTWFDTRDLSDKEQSINSYEVSKINGKSAFTPDWDVRLSYNNTSHNDSFTYPMLNASCNVEYDVGIDDNNNIIKGETVCLMDYKNEYLTEYNKTLCVNIKESNHDTVGDVKESIYNLYTDDTKHQESGVRKDIYTSYTNMMSEGFQGASNTEKTKEDQLKKDFVKMYNDNIFEIFTVSLAILVTAYLIKKY